MNYDYDLYFMIIMLTPSLFYSYNTFLINIQKKIEEAFLVNRIFKSRKLLIPNTLSRSKRQKTDKSFIIVEYHLIVIQLVEA